MMSCAITSRAARLEAKSVNSKKVSADFKHGHRPQSVKGPDVPKHSHVDIRCGLALRCRSRSSLYPGLVGASSADCVGDRHKEVDNSRKTAIL